MRETALRGGEARGHPTTTAAAKGEEKGKRKKDERRVGGGRKRRTDRTCGDHLREELTFH